MMRACLAALAFCTIHTVLAADVDWANAQPVTVE